MTRLLILCVALATGVLSAPTPTITLLKPQGIKFSIPDSPGRSLVAYHYSINSPLANVNAGQYNQDVAHKSGNEWAIENRDVVVNPGDKVYYWLLTVDNGQGTNLLDQVWTATVPTTSTTSTTTARPITHPTTQAPKQAQTQPPYHNNMLHLGGTGSQTGSQTGTSNNMQTGSSTQAPPGNNMQTSGGTSGTGGAPMTQMSGSSGSSGSCSCSGTSTAPPGSEKTCTTFPCLIFEDEFDTLNLDVWEHEITAGGGGNWEFEYYTNNRSNSYVRDSKLFIKPTLTIESLGEGPDGLTKGALDIWGSQPGDVCTGNGFYGCRRDGNPDHIINPIQSARLRSSRGFNFKYGKVEVRAKMPAGDWIWPAIWMLPLRNAYGKWPASGEIDIVEARGNRQYTDDKGQDQSVNNAGSTLHFGSDFWHNKWPTAHAEKLSSSGSYADDFHKYTLIWDEDHISISIDDDEVLNVTPTTSMWEYGLNDQDGVENPWVNGNKMAPFDKEFFLIMNVAVGGTAFFPDKNHSPTGKPWNDKSDFALRDFWNGRGQWYPTWNPDSNNGEDAAMQVDYIRVWKLKP